MTDPLFPASAAVKRLRAYYRDKIQNIDIEQLRLSMQKESDRAIVILAGSTLDDLLEYRISKNFRGELTESQKRDFLEGPISTFSSRIKPAYVFGIIDKLTAKQLDVIREMRNACAHSVFTLSF